MPSAVATGMAGFEVGVSVSEVASELKLVEAANDPVVEAVSVTDGSTEVSVVVAVTVTASVARAAASVDAAETWSE